MKVLGVAVALAAEVAPFSAATPEKAIYYWADWYHVDRIELYETLKCESEFKRDAIGQLGEVGIAQIYLKYHPGVTREQALDPDWAIRWTAMQFSKGNAKWWSCYKQVIRFA